MTFSITPIIIARGPHRECSRFTYLNNFGEKVTIPYVAWLIRGKDMNVLADTGCTAEQYAKHIRPIERPAHGRRRSVRRRRGRYAAR